MFTAKIFPVAALVISMIASDGFFAEAEAANSKQLKNIEFGVFCAKISMNRIPAPNTVEGWIQAPNRATTFHWKTRTVPASKSIAFGVRASARTANILNAEIVVTHPRIKGRSEDRWKTNFRTNKLTLDFYSFEFAHEMKPGNWTFKAVKDGNVLYQVRFKVVSAKSAPNIVKACARR